MVNIYSLTGKVKGKIKLPDIFEKGLSSLYPVVWHALRLATLRFYWVEFIGVEFTLHPDNSHKYGIKARV